VSYILEALKKLEQKRQHEGVPNLLTVQGDVPPVQKKRYLWPYIVSGIVVLNGILVLVVLSMGPWKNPVHPPPPQTQTAQESIAPPKASTQPEKKGEAIPESKKDTPIPEGKVAAQPALSRTPTLAAPKITPEPTPTKTTPVQPPIPIKTQGEPPPKTAQPVTPSSKVVHIKELPADVKSKLSDLRMTVHSYNEQPQSRFAVINNYTVREGQSVNGVLKLEQITQNGVILNYQGHRFSLGINETP
jgi:hypothetical protein